MNEQSELNEYSKNTNEIRRENSGRQVDSDLDQVQDIEKIEDTIFSIANSPEHGWFLAIGHKRITNCYPTRKQAIDQLEEDKWNIIMKMIVIITEGTIAVELDERGIKTL